jgi:hypothetical protein
LGETRKLTSIPDSIGTASTFSPQSNRFENVDRINTIFRPVRAIDIYQKRAYAIDKMFFSIRNPPVIMSNRKALISRLFYLNVNAVHEYQ